MIAKSSKQIAGFTLVELMVSIVIAATIMAMALGVYFSMKTQYMSLNEQNQLNSQQMIVKQIFYNAIGRSGFSSKYGDVSQSMIDNTGDNVSDIFSDTDMISIGKAPISLMSSLPEDMRLDEEECREKQVSDYKYGYSSAIHCIKANTDYLVIQRASISTSFKTNSSNNIFKVNDFHKNDPPANEIKSGDYLVLCNAFECDLVKVNAATGDFVSTTNRVEEKFKQGDYVGKYIVEIFYVADSGRIDKMGGPIYSLYEYVKQNAGESMSYELADGVDSLHIDYMTSSDTDEIEWKGVESSPLKLKKIKQKL